MLKEVKAVYMGIAVIVTEKKTTVMSEIESIELNGTENEKRIGVEI
jgi:hypothetical protein